MVTWITGKHITEFCADLATVVPIRRRPKGIVESYQERKDLPFDEIKITTEDYAAVLLRFEGNLRGVMTVSQVSAGRKNRLWYEIDGSESSLAWNGEEPNILWIGERKKANHQMIKDPSLMSPEARGFAAYPGGHAEGYPEFPAALQAILRLSRSRKLERSAPLPHFRKWASRSGAL